MADVSPSDGNHVVAWGDLAFAVVVIMAAAVVWFGTADLPPPRYEPVGSAALPRGIAAIMALLAVSVAVRAVRSGAPRQETLERFDGAARVAALAALLVTFVLLMDARVLGFRPAAAVFLIGACAVLGGISLRKLGAYAAFALIMSLGLHAVFTRLFYIDLP